MWPNDVVDINRAFPSKFLKAADLRGGQVTVVIAKVAEENLRNVERLVVYFHGKTKGLVLNRTNAKDIAMIAGSPLTEAWAGKLVTLYVGEAKFRGQAVPAIRVRAPQRAAPPTPVPGPSSPRPRA